MKGKEEAQTAKRCPQSVSWLEAELFCVLPTRDWWNKNKSFFFQNLVLKIRSNAHSFLERSNISNALLIFSISVTFSNLFAI